MTTQCLDIVKLVLSSVSYHMSTNIAILVELNKGNIGQILTAQCIDIVKLVSSSVSYQICHKCLTNFAILGPFSSLRISHATKLLQLIYEKLPADIASRHVLLLDPVLASG